MIKVKVAIRPYRPGSNLTSQYVHVGSSTLCDLAGCKTAPKEMKVEQVCMFGYRNTISTLGFQQ